MRALTVLYDANCALCRGARVWLGRQPAYVRLEFVAAGSTAARARFPGLDHDATLRDVTVIGPAGEVWRGEKAWLMCLWALRAYRSHAMRLASPALRPMAKRFVAWMSRQRGALAPLGSLLGGR